MAIGAVLSQFQEEKLCTIAYASRSLNKAERKYCVTRKELLAIVNFVQHFRHYLLGRRFKIRSDHQPLKWMFNLRDPSGQVARWLEILSAYQFQVEYRPGKKHNNADGLSRRPWDPQACDCDQEDDSYLPCGPCPKCHRNTEKMSYKLTRVMTRREAKRPKENEQSPPLTGTNSDEKLLGPDDSENTPDWPTSTHWLPSLTLQQLQDCQEGDPDIAPILKWKRKSDQRPMGHEMVKLSPATRNLWLAWDLLVLDKGVLCRKCPENGINCLVVPRQLQTEVLRIAHGSLLSGHMGQRRTMGRLVGKFYWFQLRLAVANWVKKCSVCSSNTRAPKKPRGPLGVMQVGAPLDRIGTDLLGPLPLTPRGNRHILVVQDYFTKWVEIYPVPDATAETCAHYILNHFVARFGIPYSIHSGTLL